MLVDGHTLRQAITYGDISVYRTGPDGNEKRVNTGDLQIGPNSVDVTLGQQVLAPLTGAYGILDPRNPDSLAYYNLPLADTDNGQAYMIQPGVVYLGFAAERFSIQENTTEKRLQSVVQMLDGRSTVGRIGVAVHVTAGFGDVGFFGNFTLEIVNHNRRPVLLYPGMRIGQIAFHEVWSSGSQQLRYNGAYANNHIGRPVPPVLGRDRF
jgi:dCTP deaminase